VCVRVKVELFGGGNMVLLWRAVTCEMSSGVRC